MSDIRVSLPPFVDFFELKAQGEEYNNEMKKNQKKVSAAMKKILKRNTLILGSPVELEKLIGEGHEIHERFISWEEYIDKLYEEKKPTGLHLLRNLPQIDKQIADSTVTSLYEDLKESVATVNATAIIVNSILLLEFAMRSSLFKKIALREKAFKWEVLEEKTFYKLTSMLGTEGIITESEKKEFKHFNDKYRDIYFHINVHAMSKDRTFPEIDTVNTETGEINTKKDVPIVEHRFLWFTGKKLFDKENIFKIQDFCIEWTNKLLT